MQIRFVFMRMCFPIKGPKYNYRLEDKIHSIRPSPRVSLHTLRASLDNTIIVRDSSYRYPLPRETGRKSASADLELIRVNQTA